MFLVFSGFYVINFNSRQNQTISVKEKVSVAKTLREERMLKVLLLLLRLLLSLSIQIFNRKFNK